MTLTRAVMKINFPLWLSSTDWTKMGIPFSLYLLPTNKLKDRNDIKTH